jgi:hypothetical protein
VQFEADHCIEIPVLNIQCSALIDYTFLSLRRCHPRLHLKFEFTTRRMGRERLALRCSKVSMSECRGRSNQKRTLRAGGIRRTQIDHPRTPDVTIWRQEIGLAPGVTQYPRVSGTIERALSKFTAYVSGTELREFGSPAPISRKCDSGRKHHLLRLIGKEQWSVPGR